MGTGSSKHDPLERQILKMWNEVSSSCAQREKDQWIERLQKKQRNSKRTGWKVVRVFVSSTFKDFNKEREILIKEVFPDLQQWCEKRRLHLVECDLRWGIPANKFDKEDVLKACLHEVDRCYEDNQWPFFINMTSERVGWIPCDSDVPDDIKDDYNWIMGLSVTEMEIIHAAYRLDNPNALILLRDPEFVDQIPEGFADAYCDNDQLARRKLKILKAKLHERFPAEQMQTYSVQVDGVEPDTKLLKLSGFDSFKKIVFEFFQRRITEQYPLDESPRDKFEEARAMHEAFMIQRCELVEGRDQIIDNLVKFIEGVDIAPDGKPLMLLGGAGIGKTSIIALSTQMIITKTVRVKTAKAKARASAKTIKDADYDKPYVFYHYVGCAPGSTDMDSMLQRFLVEIMKHLGKEVGQVSSIRNEVCSILANKAMPPVVFVIDAINQFQDFSCKDTDGNIFSWLPFELAPQIRVVFSMITESDPHKLLKKRYTNCREVVVSTLDSTTKRSIVSKILANYSKVLDSTQMNNLLMKHSSDNPLWLSIACDELRLHGNFRTLSQKINSFPNGLLDLEMQVIQRVQKESPYSKLVQATLCLLEISVGGLLENEVRALLSEEDTFLAPTFEDLSKVDFTSQFYDVNGATLPAVKWSSIYRSLKRFLRPFGDSGEGRLDFYHRSLSKTIRKLYFAEKVGSSKSSETANRYKWWHKRIGDFFLTNAHVTFERKLEELPIHLMSYPEGKDDLVKFLSQWEVLEQLFDGYYSSKLMSLWRSCSTMDEMNAAYTALLQHEKNKGARPTPENLTKLADRYFKICMLHIQCSKLDTPAELLEDLLDLEKQLGEKPERMCEAYWVKAAIWHEKRNLMKYLRPDMADVCCKIIDSCTKSVEARNKVLDDNPVYHKYWLGYAYNRMAFSQNIMLQLVEIFGPGFLTETQKEVYADSKREVTQNINTAIATFKEIGDEGNAGFSLNCKALLTQRQDLDEPVNEDAVDLMKEGERIIREHNGELHYNLHIFYYNIMLHFYQVGTEETYDAAYEYLLKNRDLAENLFGAEHPKSKLINGWFNESFVRTRVERARNKRDG